MMRKKNVHKIWEDIAGERLDKLKERYNRETKITIEKQKRSPIIEEKKYKPENKPYYDCL